MVDICAALLEAGADPTSLPDGGKGLLISAIFEDAAAMIERLITKNVPLDGLYAHMTPLELARALGKHASLAVLVRVGAPEVRADMLDLAGSAARGFLERTLALLDGASEAEQLEALRQCCGKPGQAHVAKALAGRLSALLKVAGLCFAAKDEQIEIIDAFLEAGAAIDAQSPSPDMTPGVGRPALVHAARGNSVNAAGRLLIRGANPNAADHRGETALHEAAERNRLEMAQLLVAQGADLHAVDHAGRTPLQVAESRGSTETMYWLEDQLEM